MFFVTFINKFQGYYTFWVRWANNPDMEASSIRLIDVQSSVEDFVNQIVRCEFAASSSLHGIIISHAYGIPAVWIKFRDLPSGDDSKFHDYFLSVGMKVPEVFQISAYPLESVRLAKYACLPSHLPDLNLLWESCPFRPNEPF